MASAKSLLKDYNTKRDFSVTSEPEGDKRSGKSSGNSFVVQKHDARALHYDFRIELDGVLKSWAVTKGPSNAPSDKRLAVRVEDHPLAYGAFEGTIPEKQYGGGTVMLWDQGSWEPIGDPHDGLANGDLKMRLNGERMKGEWVLVHMKGRDKTLKNGEKRENWLLIKHKDDQARDENNLTERFTRSVETGRNFDEIAKGLKPKKKTRTPVRDVWDTSAKDEAATETKSKTKPKPKPAVKSGKSPTLPKFQSPQLATLVDRVPTGGQWQFEMKYDGYRSVAAVAGDNVRIYTRNGNDWTDKFGVLVDPFAALTPKSALIDGEICAFDKKGRTDFSTLKTHLADGGPLTFFAFDLLEFDGKDLRKKPLSDRQAQLESLIGKPKRNDPIQVSPSIEAKGEELLNALCGDGFEGIIAKKSDAPYRNSRSKAWLKIKCTKRQEFVIAGWSPSNKLAFASLLIGTWEGHKLIYRGRVGTGFSDADRDQLYGQLKKAERKTSPFDTVPDEIARTAHWTKPALVGEVAFTEFTPDGYLRHPSFIALREDKRARQVHMDQPKKTPKVKSETLTTEQGVKAAEREKLRLTSPGKVMFQSAGVTKGELIAYYDLVAGRMLAHAANRPLSIVRCPDGRGKQCFYQKHDSGGFPDELKRIAIKEGSGKTEDYFYFTDRAGLFAGVQMGVLEYHIWGVHQDEIERPDRIIFDLDPDEGLDFSDVKTAAEDVRKLLDALGLKSFPMVTGGKGVHVIAPLTRRTEWPEVKSFCKAVAVKMAGDSPDRFTATMSKAKRKGKIFIDYLRNERGSTAIAPWSTRAREGAPVAVPVTWAELKKLDSTNGFSLAAAAARVKKPDPWKGYDGLNQSITKAMVKQLGA